MKTLYFTLTALIVLVGFSSVHAAPKYSDWTTPVNLGPVVNSAFRDNTLTISKDELTIYFGSRRPGGFGDFDIWVSQRATRDSSFGAPVNLGAVVNSTLADALVAFSRDGHMMFFSSARPGGFAGPGGPFVNFFDVYVTERKHTHDDFGWEAPVILGPDINTVGVHHLAPHILGQSLYQSLGDLAGEPNLDTYVSTFSIVNGVFGTPVIIPELNSVARDARPNLTKNGLEIFFYSSRVGGFGANDLWTSTRMSTNDPWSTPVNLGAIVNTSATEQHPSISSDGLTLYFASNRPGGSGDRDLSKTTRTELND